MEKREQKYVDVPDQKSTPKEVVGVSIRPRMTLADYAAKLVERGYDSYGRQIPDPVPLAPPIGFKESPSMVEIIRKMVRDERLAQELDAQGMETFEEADDFDVGDENAEELRSGFENEFEPPAVEQVRQKLTKAAEKKAAEAAKDAAAAAKAKSDATD